MDALLDRKVKLFVDDKNMGEVSYLSAKGIIAWLKLHHIRVKEIPELNLVHVFSV